MTISTATHVFSLYTTRSRAHRTRVSRKCLSDDEVLERIATWLDSRFPEDNETPARLLGKTSRTIRNWRALCSEPGATSIVRILIHDPGAAPFLTGESDDL